MLFHIAFTIAIFYFGYKNKYKKANLKYEWIYKDENIDWFMDILYLFWTKNFPRFRNQSGHWKVTKTSVLLGHSICFYFSYDSKTTE